jgi:hypothetical protein
MMMNGDAGDFCRLRRETPSGTGAVGFISHGTTESAGILSYVAPALTRLGAPAAPLARSSFPNRDWFGNVGVQTLVLILLVFHFESQQYDLHRIPRMGATAFAQSLD